MIGRHIFTEPRQPKRSEILDNNWFDFLSWCHDKVAHTGMGAHYEYYQSPDSSGVPHNVPIANETNFWFWWLEYRHKGALDEYNRTQAGRGA